MYIYKICLNNFYIQESEKIIFVQKIIYNELFKFCNIVYRYIIILHVRFI